MTKLLPEDKLRFFDFIPYFGMQNYVKRNSKGRDVSEISYNTKKKATYLFLYNATLGTTALYFLASNLKSVINGLNSLESLLK